MIKIKLITNNEQFSKIFSKSQVKILKIILWFIPQFRYISKFISKFLKSDNKKDFYFCDNDNKIIILKLEKIEKKKIA